MTVKLIGAVLIVAACGYFGFSASFEYRQEESMLRCLQEIISAMHRELDYRLPPLQELCRNAAQNRSGTVGNVFASFSAKLEEDSFMDATYCMASTIQEFPDLPPKTRCALELFGKNAGRYDLEGQLRGLEEISSYCRQELDKLAENREIRLRSYQTLGLCAGAALVIIFI